MEGLFVAETGSKTRLERAGRFWKPGRQGHREGVFRRIPPVTRARGKQSGGTPCESLAQLFEKA